MENKSGSETSKSTNIKHKQQNINTITIPSSDFDSSSDKNYYSYSFMDDFIFHLH